MAGRLLAPLDEDDFINNKRLVGFVSQYQPFKNNEHEREQVVS
jgi:hypothetical protein